MNDVSKSQAILTLARTVEETDLYTKELEEVFFQQCLAHINKFSSDQILDVIDLFPAKKQAIANILNNSDILMIKMTEQAKQFDFWVGR